MTEKKPKFLRRKTHAHSKLGKRRKNKQKWRRPTGRDNKMREKRKGTPAVVSIGYKKASKEKVILVSNLAELEKTKAKEIKVGKLGLKKKIVFAKRAKELGIKITNLNISKILKKEKKPKKKEETKQKTEKKPEEKKK